MASSRCELLDGGDCPNSSIVPFDFLLVNGLMVPLLSLISSKDVDGVRMESNIFSGLFLSSGFGLVTSTRPRNTDAAEPSRGCCICPLDEDCCFLLELETKGDFGKWIGVVPPITKVVTPPEPL